MGKFFKAYAEFFKESPIGMKFNIVFMTLITPVLIFACIEAFVEFLNNEPQLPGSTPLSDSEAFKNCIDSIKDYEDPRFDSAIESCMEIGMFRE
jgi:hypothetical protein